MAITEGSILEIVVSGRQGAPRVMNVWQFLVTGTFSGISAGAVANAFWQASKATYRAVASDAYTLAFDTVFVQDLTEPLGEYGEYAVPTGEQPGTRSTGAAQGLPSFNAVGVKLAVGTRVTRPGQKRFAWMTEADNVSGVVESGVITAINNLMTALQGGLTLGVPALGMDLQMVVVSKDPETGLVTAHQEVVGWAVNSSVTSQVSRKPGRGI